MQRDNLFSWRIPATALAWWGILMLLLSTPGFARELPVVEITDETPEVTHIGAQAGVFPMGEDNLLGPDEIYDVPDSLYWRWAELDTMPDHHSAWIKVYFANLTENTITRHGLICHDHLELEFYSTDHKGKLSLAGEGGFLVHPNNRLIPSLDNLFFIHLEPGEKRPFFIHSKLREGDIPHHYLHLFLRGEIFDFVGREIHQNSLQSFLSGILVVFAAVGLIMFLSFRERIFLYFAAMMVSLTVYFASIQGLLYFIISLPPDFMYRYITGLALSAVTLSSYLFTVRYLNLRAREFRLFRLYSVVAIFAVALPSVHFFFPMDIEASYLLSNIAGVLFLSLLLGMVIYYYFKGVKEAGVLLLSSVLILTGGITYGLSLMGFFTTVEIFLNSFKIGAIAFSGNLLYGLFDRISTIQQEKIQFRVEREKSDELLFNVLPEEVAMELREKGQFEAREFENISVLFTDFKDFTATASHMSPHELVHEINDCFIAFDKMAEKYGVEKIKTIGDSYMAAAGLTGDQTQQCANLVHMALEMQQYMQKRKRELMRKGKPAFDMRAGIHTGPVVAGIVGEKKFQYDIWGDTVNTASRMESNGEPGKVNISRQTYELISDSTTFSFEKRPNRQAKGKGEVEMWFVEYK